MAKRQSKGALGALSLECHTFLNLNFAYFVSSDECYLLQFQTSNQIFQMAFKDLLYINQFSVRLFMHLCVEIILENLYWPGHPCSCPSKGMKKKGENYYQSQQVICSVLACKSKSWIMILNNSRPTWSAQITWRPHQGKTDEELTFFFFIQNRSANI